MNQLIILPEVLRFIAIAAVIARLRFVKLKLKCVNYQLTLHDDCH